MSSAAAAKDAGLLSALQTLGWNQDQAEKATVEDIANALKAADGTEPAIHVEKAVVDDEARKILSLIDELADELKPDLVSAPPTWIARWDLACDGAGAAEHYNPSEDVITDHTKIKQRYKALWEAAIEGQCDEWELSGPSYILALVILLDQMSRIFTPDHYSRYSQDFAAQTFASCLVESKSDDEFTPIQRMFTYMPFLHSEDVESQQTGRKLFDKLARDFPELFGSLFGKLVKVAEANIELLQRFSRFPQRNQSMSRASTPEEVSYLASLEMTQSLAAADER